MARKQKAETPIVKRALEHMAVDRIFSGGEYWRQNSGRIRGKYKAASRTLPDIVGVSRWGMFCCVEVKTHDGELTDEQWDFLRDKERRGALARVYVEDTFYALADVPAKNLPASKRGDRGSV